MRFTELRLPGGSLPEQRAFYSQTLGLPLVADRDDALSVQVGASVLGFHADHGAGGAAHFAINIPENRFAEAKRWLGER